MIKLSSGVEISEDTVVAALLKAGYEATIVSALKKAGISVEPKHVFNVGDVARSKHGKWRMIVKVNGKLQSIDKHGLAMGDEVRGVSQKHFQDFGYEYIGKLNDMLR